MNKKILIGVPPKAHVTLAQQEVQGFKDIGYDCQTVLYGRNDQGISKANKFFGVVSKAFTLIKALYSFTPHYLYLNSRFEPMGSARDFISLLLVKMFYYKKLIIVVKSHGSEYSILQKKSFFYKSLVIPFLQKNVAAWFFLSQEEKRLITECNATFAKKVFVTANIIDASRSEASATFKNKYHLNNNLFNFLYVGRMVKVKGIFNIVTSIPLLQNRDDCFFTFVGDGDDLEDLKIAAEAVGAEKNVQFAGYIPDNECDHFYANVDALIFPTYDTEGFPMALFKSVALGLPIITTKIRAAKDYLVEPDNVLWVKEQSPQSIASAVDNILQNEKLRSTMQINNIELGKKFSQQKVCSQMSEVLESIII
jgi:glycosyltransferase involved in cell wall biosynthesis